MTKRPRVAAPTSRPKASHLALEQFRFADQLGLHLPQLVLGIEVDRRELAGDSRRDYAFQPGRQWHKLAIQTAGVASRQRYLIGTLLRPSERAAKGIPIVYQRWRATSVGAQCATLTQLGAYRADVKQLFGADCDQSYAAFAEAFYPVDLTYLPELAADALPNPLDDLIRWDSGFDRMAFANRWTLGVLTPNVSE